MKPVETRSAIRPSISALVSTTWTSRSQHEEHEQRCRPGEGDGDEEQRQAEQRRDHESCHEADDPARDLCRRAS